MRAANGRLGGLAMGVSIGLLIGAGPAAGSAVGMTVWDEPAAAALDAPAWDLSSTAGARAFALAVVNDRAGEAERTAALIEAARANLAAYKAAGPAGDAALIEAVLELNADDFESAIAAAERAVAASPGDAETHYVLGTAIINEVSQGSFGFSTFGKVNRAKAAWEDAIELDPRHVGGRISLAMYYLNAPGIAGGDKEKAESYGEDLIRTGDTSWGRRILLMVSLKRKKWDDARERLDEMLAAAETDGDRREAYQTYLYPVLLEHERADDAIEVLPGLERVSEADDPVVHYLWGRAYQERNDRGDRDRAIDAYARAVEANAGARGSRWRLAELLRKADRDAEAAVHYREFAERFPDHEDAKKAGRYAERLSR